MAAGRSASRHFSQAGVLWVTFIASDGVLADSEAGLITVRELGNPGARDCYVDRNRPSTGRHFDHQPSPTDPEGQALTLTYSTAPMTGITLVDNLDGTAVAHLSSRFSLLRYRYRAVFATDNGTPGCRTLR